MSVTISEKDKPKVNRSDLPGPEHVKEALTSLNKLRDRALIFLTWDSGARIGEVLNLKWKDIEFRENGLKVHIRESKSMQRDFPGRAPANPEGVEELVGIRRS
jgi:integrase